MPFDADVVVVGSGAGGATLAYACARAAKSVLLLERGPRPTPTTAHDERATLIEKKPYDDRSIDVNGSPRRLYMGGVLGGGTALFGAALMRPSPDEFHPGRSYGHRIARELWDWPISYDALEPYYTQAESLYGLAGCSDDDFGPLAKPADGFRHPALPLHPINQRLMSANREHGLRPFRLPLAIDAGRCLQCSSCPGFICPTGARHSSVQLLDQAAPDNLRVVTHAHAERVVFDGAGQPVGIDAIDRATGQRTIYRGRRYVIAAGAIGSPLLLLRSGLDHPLIGRNYMMHLSPIVVGLFARPIGAEDAFVKQVGFVDYYRGTKDHPHKFGLVQSLPVPGLLMLSKAASRFLPRFVLEFLRRRMLPLVGIVEDLPKPENRVTWDSAGRPCLHHQFDRYDIERGRHLARWTAQILQRTGAVWCVTSQFASAEHVAHQCGTLRFGSDPAHAVLDADCRLHGHPNVFVVDGSFMPTSLGVGPALTIMANALRVARIVSAEV